LCCSIVMFFFSNVASKLSNTRSWEECNTGHAKTWCVMNGIYTTCNVTQLHCS
jgi:hypothetical protein